MGPKQQDPRNTVLCSLLPVQLIRLLHPEKLLPFSPDKLQRPTLTLSNGAQANSVIVCSPLPSTYIGLKQER